MKAACTSWVVAADTGAAEPELYRSNELNTKARIISMKMPFTHVLLHPSHRHVVCKTTVDTAEPQLLTVHVGATGLSTTSFALIVITFWGGTIVTCTFRLALLI